MGAIGSVLDRLSCGYYRYLRNIGYILFWDHLYDGLTVENTIQTAFGCEDMMMQRKSTVPHTNVAVVVDETRHSKCEIFASYNKSDHAPESLYGWPPERLHRDITIWKA